VTLAAPVWMPAAGANPAYCRVNGRMSPIDPSAPDINFQVVLPSSWAHRIVQLGGGGQNGVIPGLTGGPGGATYLARGWVASGSDSGHQTSDQANNWAINDESIRNLGYMQMKKTHDAAIVLTERMYGARPVYSYWVGSSQGGREGVTVAKRYPNDYDGILVSVPIVGYSSLMLSRALHRIQEAPLANWIPSQKVTTIATNVIRQCDGLDGLLDGVVNNYRACRELFDVKRSPGATPWAPIRCPGNVDPNPSLNTDQACLTDGQISTMNFVQTRYPFATALAFSQRTFGMWVPNTDPGGSGMITNTRYRGQEGAAPNAPVYNWLGVAIVGMLWGDMSVNPLDYVEGGALNDRRIQLSEWLDGTHPDLNAFMKKGGKLLSMVGTNDSLASSGQQLDYYQALIDRMGRPAIDSFARLWVLPGAGHGLSGNNYRVDGNGQPLTQRAIPNNVDRFSMLVDWVENGIAPPMTAEVSGGGRTMPLCSYPAYPRYKGNALPTDVASSYECATD
jgi:feruloyl esterase